MFDFSELDGFDWDTANVKKVSQRVDLTIVEAAFFSDPLVMEDREHSLVGEDRYQLISLADPRPVFVVFAFRKSRIRVISARYMHKKEVGFYGKKK